MISGKIYTGSRFSGFHAPGKKTPVSGVQAPGDALHLPREAGISGLRGGSDVCLEIISPHTDSNTLKLKHLRYCLDFMKMLREGQCVDWEIITLWKITSSKSNTVKCLSFATQGQRYFACFEVSFRFKVGHGHFACAGSQPKTSRFFDLQDTIYRGRSWALHACADSTTTNFP